MVAFPSPAWVDELDAELRAAPPLPAGTATYVVEQVIPDAPEGELRYHVVIGPDGLRAFAGAAKAPDVVLTTTARAALSIRQGARSAQAAIADGQCRVTGDARALVVALPLLRARVRAIPGLVADP